MLDVLRGTVGASYSLVGGPITGYQSFSCVGLSEFALEAIGRSTIPANQEVLASVPLEQFMLTLPVREVTMHVGDTLEMPVYGTVVHPGSQRTSGRYCPHDAKKNPGAVLPCCEGPVCNDFVIQGLDLPPTATFERTVPGKYLFKWTPTAADDGKTHTFRLHMIAPNVTVAGTLWGRNDLGTKEIDETFTIHVDPCPEGYAVAPTFSVEPLHAVFTQQTFSTAYSTTVANPAGEPLTATWSGPSCDEFSPSAPVGPSTEPTQPLSMSWIHRHPPCDPTTDHAATTVVLDVAGPSGTIRCTYQGSDDGTGPACAPR